MRNVNYRRPTGRGLAVRVAAWTLWGFSLLLSVITLSLAQTEDFVSQASFTAPVFLMGTIGLVILLRSSNQRIGWLLLVIGAWGALGGFSGKYAEYAFLIDPAAALPLRWPAAWLQHWAWFPLLGMLFMVLPQMFPTGQPMPSRWNTVFWLTIGYVVLFTIILAFGRTPIELLDTTLPNPYGFIPLDQPSESPLGFIFVVPLLGVPIVSAASLAVRARRSRGNERQQIKWIAFALGILVASFALSAIYSLVLEGDCCGAGPAVFHLLGALAFLAVPAAIGISILRYRLYDIDRLIRRTLAYGILTAALAVTYFVTVLLLQQIFPAQSQLAIVLSTLAVTALFSPLRQRIQSAIDRRFYRKRYDPEEALAAFSANLRNQLNSEEISESMLSLMEETLRPAHASVWIRNS